MQRIDIVVERQATVVVTRLPGLNVAQRHIQLVCRLQAAAQFDIPETAPARVQQRLRISQSRWTYTWILRSSAKIEIERIAGMQNENVEAHLLVWTAPRKH